MPLNSGDATEDRTNKDRWAEVANYLLSKGESYTKAKKEADRVTRSALRRRIQRG